MIAIEMWVIIILSSPSLPANAYSSITNIQNHFYFWILLVELFFISAYIFVILLAQPIALHRN